MCHISLCVSTVLLLAAVAGCGNSKTPADSAGVQPNEPTVGASTVDDSKTVSGTTELTNAAATESGALKQAMIDVTVDLMKEQQPNTEPDVVRGQVENAIAQIRNEVPDFLMVSAKNEEKLQAGTRIEGVDKRIADAEAFLSEAGIQFAGLVASLLSQHKAGTLSPVRTELLAQLIVADMKKTEAALTN